MTTVPSSVQATPFGQRSGTVTEVGRAGAREVVAVNVVFAFGGSDAPVGGVAVAVRGDADARSGRPSGAPASECDRQRRGGRAGGGRREGDREHAARGRASIVGVVHVLAAIANGAAGGGRAERSGRGSRCW